MDTFLRAQIAASILSGMVAGFNNDCKPHGIYIPFDEYANLAKHAVQMADALIAELNAKAGTKDDVGTQNDED